MVTLLSDNQSDAPVCGGRAPEAGGRPHPTGRSHTLHFHFHVASDTRTAFSPPPFLLPGLFLAAR